MGIKSKFAVLSRSHRMFKYKGWQNLCMDWAGFQRDEYEYNGIQMRPNTTDKWIALEHTVLRTYSIADEAIKKASLIIDVGANVGFFKQYVREQNLNAKIVCFEPMKDSFNRIPLGAHTAKYMYPVTGDGHNVLLHNPFHGGFANVTTTPDEHGVWSVPARQLLQFACANHCDLLKLDCEGEEVDILKNLDLSKFGAVILEWHSPHKPEDIMVMLNSAFTTVKRTNHTLIYATR